MGFPTFCSQSCKSFHMRKKVQKTNPQNQLYPSFPPELCPPSGSTEPQQEASGRVRGQLQSRVYQGIGWRRSAEPDGARARCQHHLVQSVRGVPPAPRGAAQVVVNAGGARTPHARRRPEGRRWGGKGYVKVFKIREKGLIS